MSSILGALGVGGGSIGRASVDLILNSTAYQAQLAEAEAKTKSTSGGMSQALSSIKDAIGPVGVAAAGAAAIAVVGITKAIGVTTEWASEVRSLQRVTGQSAESASALAGAGQLLGIDVTSLTTGFGLLEKNIVNASANLTKYGIATQDAGGHTLPFDTVLSNVIDKFNQLPQGGEQAAFAMNIFGRSGKTLIPILQQGQDGLAALEAEVAKSGLVMNQQGVDAAKNLSIATRALGESFKGVAVQIGTLFVPIATKMVQAFAQGVQAALHFGQALGTALKPVISFIAPVIQQLGQSFSDFGKALGDAFAQVGAALAPIMPQLKELAAALIGASLVPFIAALKLLAFVIENASKAVQIFASLLSAAFTTAINGVIAGINLLIHGYNAVVDSLNAVLGTHFKEITVLGQVTQATDATTAAVTKEAAANQDATTKIQGHTAAMRQLRLAQLQAAGGFLGLVGTLQQSVAAQAAYNKLQRQGKLDTEAGRQATIDATQAQLDFRTAVRQFQQDHPQASVQSLTEKLREMATQAGISGKQFKAALGGPLNEIIDLIHGLNATPINLRVNTSQIDAAAQKLHGLQQALSRGL